MQVRANSGRAPSCAPILRLFLNQVKDFFPISVVIEIRVVFQKFGKKGLVLIERDKLHFRVHHTHPLQGDYLGRV